MSYTPWMRSLLNRMKELYNKPNAKTIAEALPEVGSGGSDNTFKVTFTISYNPLTISCDKTLEELSEAFYAGKVVYANVEDRTYFLESIDAGDGVAIFVATNGVAMFTIYTPMWSDDWMITDYRIAMKPELVNVSGSSPTISPVPDTVYKCGTLSALTISNPPAYGAYSIIFYSGATPTVVTGIDNFTVQANKRYRIDVSDGYATFDSWPYTP